MDIKTSLSEARSVSSQIKQAGNNIILPEVNAAAVTGVQAQTNCVSLFDSMKGLLETYNSQVQTDAKNITSIAWELSQLDEDLAGNVNFTKEGK